jgi:hypothetical protein
MGAYDSFLKQAKVAAAVINDSLDLREQEIAAREDAVSQREQAVLDLIGKAAHMCDRMNARLDAVERQHEREEEEPVEDPPRDDEGDIEPIPAKEPNEMTQLSPEGPQQDDEDTGRSSGTRPDTTPGQCIHARTPD